MALSCQGCNNRKFTATEAVDPATMRLVPLFHPRRDRWYEHFAWSSDGLEVLGMTATGRATVERLQLNREELLNLRGVLAAAGKHPPDCGG